MQEENFDNIEQQNISVVKFSSNEQSQQGDQRNDKFQVNQQDRENSIFFIEHQDDFNLKQQNNEAPLHQEEEIEIIQFAENRDVFFDNNQEEVDNNIPEQQGEQIIVQNIPVSQYQYNTNLNDRNIPIFQEPQQQHQVQQLQIQYSPVPNQQHLAMIPTQQFTTPLQPTDQYDNKQDKSAGEVEKNKQKKKLQKQDDQHNDKHYQNNFVIVPINSNEAPQNENVIINLGANLSAYCCLGLLNRSDSCCQWICDLTVYCLTLPLFVFGMGAQKCAAKICAQVVMNHVKQVAVFQALIVMLQQFKKEFKYYLHIDMLLHKLYSFELINFGMLGFVQSILFLDVFNFLWTPFSLLDCVTQICTFCCDCLQNSCEQICQFLSPVCDSFCEVLSICCKCMECLK